MPTPHRLQITDGDGDRDGVGGRPYLRDGRWPVCQNERVVTGAGHRRCGRFGQPLTHFLRFDVRPEWGTPFAAGSHVSVFTCAGCADAWIPPAGSPPFALRERFWEGNALEPGTNYSNQGWWYAALDPPGAPLVRATSPEPFLAPRALVFTPDEEETPCVGRVLRRSPATCPCGSPMEFLLHLPFDVKFPTLPGAPAQAGTMSSKAYMLFLGNELTLLACAKGCHPRSIVPFAS